ncbi:hypothetical protein F2Q68_00036928 [Brassica cretica]|nr:hypothetical protein F2Q68_00036928 [Brassica cretica]
MVVRGWICDILLLRRDPIPLRRSLSRRVDYGEALSRSQGRVQRDFLGDALSCRVVYGSGGGVSSVCSSLESWFHGFFASELSREIVTVSLWESCPLVLKGGTRARDSGSGVVYLSRFSLGGVVIDYRSMWLLPPLPDVILVLRERLFSSSSWCLGGVVQNQGFGFKAMWFRGELLGEGFQVDWASRVRRLNLFGSTNITLSSSLNCRDAAVQSSRVGWFTGLRYLCLEIPVVSPTLGGSYGAARAVCFSVSRFGRSSGIS